MEGEAEGSKELKSLLGGGDALSQLSSLSSAIARSSSSGIEEEKGEDKKPEETPPDEKETADKPQVNPPPPPPADLAQDSEEQGQKETKEEEEKVEQKVKEDSTEASTTQEPSSPSSSSSTDMLQRLLSSTSSSSSSPHSSQNQEQQQAPNSTKVESSNTLSTLDLSSLTEKRDDSAVKDSQKNDLSSVLGLASPKNIADNGLTSVLDFGSLGEQQKQQDKELASRQGLNVELLRQASANSLLGDNNPLNALVSLSQASSGMDVLMQSSSSSQGMSPDTSTSSSNHTVPAVAEAQSLEPSSSTSSADQLLSALTSAGGMNLMRSNSVMSTHSVGSSQMTPGEAASNALASLVGLSSSSSSSSSSSGAESLLGDNQVEKSRLNSMDSLSSLSLNLGGIGANSLEQALGLSSGAAMQKQSESDPTAQDEQSRETKTVQDSQAMEVDEADKPVQDLNKEETGLETKAEESIETSAVQDLKTDATSKDVESSTATTTAKDDQVVDKREEVQEEAKPGEDVEQVQGKDDRTPPENKDTCTELPSDNRTIDSKEEKEKSEDPQASREENKDDEHNEAVKEEEKTPVPPRAEDQNIEEMEQVEEEVIDEEDLDVGETTASSAKEEEKQQQQEQAKEDSIQSNKPEPARSENVEVKSSRELNGVSETDKRSDIIGQMDLDKAEQVVEEIQEEDGQADKKDTSVENETTKEGEDEKKGSEREEEGEEEEEDDEDVEDESNWTVDALRQKIMESEWVDDFVKSWFTPKRYWRLKAVEDSEMGRKKRKRAQQEQATEEENGGVKVSSKIVTDADRAMYYALTGRKRKMQRLMEKNGVTQVFNKKSGLLDIIGSYNHLEEKVIPGFHQQVLLAQQHRQQQAIMEQQLLLQQQQHQQQLAMQQAAALHQLQGHPQAAQLAAAMQQQQQKQILLAQQLKIQQQQQQRQMVENQQEMQGVLQQQRVNLNGMGLDEFRQLEMDLTRRMREVEAQVAISMRAPIPDKEKIATVQQLRVHYAELQRVLQHVQQALAMSQAN